jgi:hypothetical protein
MAKLGCRCGREGVLSVVVNAGIDGKKEGKKKKEKSL